MRAGVVTKWFNRGQPVVGRYLRSALDELGHETLRPRPAQEGTRPDAGRAGSRRRLGPARGDRGLELRHPRWPSTRPGSRPTGSRSSSATRTTSSTRSAGCASAGSAPSAGSSGSTSRPSTSRGRRPPTTSSTRSPAPSRRATPRWGSRAPTSPGAATRSWWPSARRGGPREDGLVRFVFPGGFLGHRKPVEQVIEAFTRTTDRAPAPAGQDAGQAQAAEAGPPGGGRGRPRIEVLVDDEATADHLQRFAAYDVCVAPARWEGLGLPLYEAMAFGMPVDHQRRPAAERGDRRRGATACSSARHTDGETTRSGHPRPHAGRRRAGGGDRAPRRRRAARDASAEGSCELRDGERAWAHTVDGIGALAEGSDVDEVL